ncbi:MAG: hypothetical protein JJU35_14625 [Balneolales bacterium]|nr:hypothetical protein [Balneolales bacterium]
MDQLVQQITARLCRKLNEEQPYYTPADLAEAGYPDFLISRIRLELERNLRESIVPPESDWASMSAPDVRQAWGLFLDAINSEVRLPKSFARGVAESAVADLIDLLSGPRAHFPEYLFGNEDSLSAAEVNSRMRLMVVYPHLGLFLPRYMKKRGLSSVSAAQYGRLLTQLDERVCRGYSPLNWVQLLEPLFVLCGGEVEGELLARFFREKGLGEHARRLRDLPDPLDTQQLVELLSRPVYNYDEPDPASEKTSPTKPAAVEASQPEGSGLKNEHLSAEPKPSKKAAATGSIAAAAFAASASASRQTPQTAEETAATEQDLHPGPEATDDHEGGASAGEEVASGEFTQKNKSTPANKMPEPEGTEPTGEDTEEVPLYRRFAAAGEQEDDGHTSALPAHEEEAEAEAETEDEADENEVHQLPRFSSFERDDDDDDEVQLTEDAEEQEDDSDEPFIPLWQRLSIDNETEETDRQNAPAPDNARLEELFAFLLDDEKRFMKEIFEGDRIAYVNALERISGFDNWREAGKYLTNDIFRRYEIDMYKDVSIDFTDRLHKFFKNYA